MKKKTEKQEEQPTHSNWSTKRKLPFTFITLETNAKTQGKIDLISNLAIYSFPVLLKRNFAPCSGSI